MSLNLVIINRTEAVPHENILKYLEELGSLKLREDIYLVEGSYSSVDGALFSRQDKTDTMRGYRVYSLSAFCQCEDTPQPQVSKLCAHLLKNELLCLSEKI